MSEKEITIHLDVIFIMTSFLAFCYTCLSVNAEAISNTVNAIKEAACIYI